MIRRPVVLGLAVALATPAAAQLPPGLGAGLGGASVRLRTADSTAAATFAGVAVGGRVRIGFRFAAVEGSYLEGTLDPDSAGGVSRDLVDGSLLAAVTPVSWLTLKAGPHVRSWVFVGGTQRWVWWEGHARVDGELAGAGLRAHLELWTAFSSDVNVPGGAGAARGGEAGLTVRIARPLVWARLTYTIDRTAFSDTGATEMLEALRLTLMLGGR